MGTRPRTKNGREIAGGLAGSHGRKMAGQMAGCAENPQILAVRPFARPFSANAAFLLTVGSFLLTVELFYLQLTVLASLLTVGAFLLTTLASLLTVGAFRLQWESASNKGL